MIIIYGMRLYGKIDACGSIHRATRFLHLWYLPLIPVGSVQLVEGGASAIEAPFSLRSVAAGYLRTWGVLSTIGFGIAFAAACSSARGIDEGGDALGTGLLFVLSLAG